MINTQRLIIMNIMLALLTSTVMTADFVYKEKSGEGLIETFRNDSLFNAFNEQLQQEQGFTTMSDEEVIYGDIKTENPVQENKVGNSIIIGGKVFFLFLYGLFPFGLPWWEATDIVVVIIMIALATFRTLLLIITVIEIYFVYMNKKAS